MKKTSRIYILIALLSVTMLANATYLRIIPTSQDDKTHMSKKIKKDKPQEPVPVFVVPQMQPFPVGDDSSSPITQQPSPNTPLSLSERIDSILEKNRTTTVTTTQYTRARHRRNRRAIKVTKVVERKYQLGCLIYDLTADSVVYSHDADNMMTPASTQKLFVATTFLETRGKDFNFETSMTTDGKTMTDSVGRPFFKGDIYLHGSFDPTLTTEDVRTLTNALRSLNVDSIDGRIIVDDHQKAAVMKHRGWQWDNIPLSEEFTFTPVTFNEGRGTAKGRVRHPELNFASTIAKQLMADSIRFSSAEPWDVSMTRVSGKRTLHKLVTPCSRILARMLKRSNNTYAESIMLNICKDNDDWTYERCRDEVRSTVRSSIGYANKHRSKDEQKRSENDLQGYYTVIDGSGLSHSNKTTARSQVNLLRYIASRRTLFDEIYLHLPIAAVDGTISRRMSGPLTKNNVRAKTGTVNAVSTLTGYVTASNGHLLIFSTLVNGTYDQGFAHSLQDKICEEIAR